ncbi:flavodoxin family protein [Brevibacillus sp. SYP-B805]|uniref:flavodoxin family protein n=1 Tax=Brevibacillus sp. SYP-B805 TaxID=1578199 RepID=UPI0013EE1713|nr:flavodoxin family protein [Brevibacillus sp. SYP-B805]NGQ95922.1 flavodoxin family protein [Brevibacillus sp. SYP-B805]
MLILYGSTRRGGNTEWLTERMVEGLPATRIYLREKQIRPIQDMRHTAEGFSPVDDDYDEVVQEMLRHDAIVFATPLYWYGMSGLMKNFIDRWSQSLRDPDLDFKAQMRTKKAYVVIVGGDNPRIEALPLVGQFTHIFRYFGMEFAHYLIGKGNKPGDVQRDEQAIAQAAQIRKALLD